jgi:LPXTG-motif cell wall-anchored protein
VKGARALASGMLVLAAICAVPAVSAAQDVGTTTDTTATTTTVDPPAAPSESPLPDAPTAGAAAGTPPEAATGSEETTTTLRRAAPADAPAGGARAAASQSVNMGDFFFSPASVTISVGDTVTWHNSGQAPHTATADDGSFDTGTINAGGSGSHTFNSAGTFSYICTIHPNMKGTVRVLSSGGSGGSGGSAGSSSSSSGTSESSAVASPDAAGNSTTLPMTGMAVGGLALAGLAMLAGGLLVRHRSSARNWLSIF